MKKIISVGILTVSLFVGGAFVGAGFDLFKSDINKELKDYKDNLEMRVGQSESNSIAFYTTELEKHKNEEVEKAKAQLDKVAEVKMGEIGDVYKKRLEADKKELTKYVDEKVKELSNELKNMN